MSHIRNIKEMLSLQTGSRNVATSGYSSFTDSQLFSGSLFWPENSQGGSQDMSWSSRTSQQSSQEGSDPKFLSSYHTKPLLFGDVKDRNKAFGILDKFEEDKKKAKEKTDRDHLTKDFLHFQETLSNIQQQVAGTEENTVICKTILEHFDKFSSTYKVNSHKNVTTDLEERVLKSGESTTELGSNLQCLKKSVECLREEQERERNMLEEALKLLSILVTECSAKSSPKVAVDSAIQTSPGLEQQISNSLQDNKLEDSQLSNNFKHSQDEVPPWDPDRTLGKRKLALRGQRRCKKRPLVLSQRSKHAFTDENSQPSINCNKQQNVSEPRYECHDMNNNQDGHCLKPLNRGIRSKAEGCVITSVSCWSRDSGSPDFLAGNKSFLDNFFEESKTATPVKPEGLFALFDKGRNLEF
ncbi:interactor of HORMAD1 protein 1 isoform X2 [Notolabrus celidotus]|uniref:interactor of HORMAD1 protein 1 isoform X2 n=1 Tax=Notolabrus celidotus TaxID=1203425 RepID=UPI001490066B|nr:interactor of HORMAD1 protein 1 isoform X2 [Notolabrus celidotus]